MLFNSYTFLIFFSVVLVVHYLPLSWRLKKLNLLLASYTFYAAWNPPFLVLLWVSTIVDWHCARWLNKTDNLSARGSLLFVSLFANLGLLGYFKYAMFFMGVFTAMLSGLGVTFVAPELDIVLPIGISFYTFQTLSYTIDVYRRRIGPWTSPLDFALYVGGVPIEMQHEVNWS